MALVLAAGDLLVVIGAVLGALALRLDWPWTSGSTAPSAAASMGAVAAATKLPVFAAFGLHRRYWRYADVRDVLVIPLAVALGTAVFAAIVVAGWHLGFVPRVPPTVLVIDAILTLTGVAAIRLFARLASERWHPPQAPPAHSTRPRRVLVAGAGETGALVVREMQRNPQLGLQPVAFLDDNPAKRGREILEVPILGGLPELEALAVAHRADEVVIAMPTAPGSTIRTVVDACQRAGIGSRAVPGVFELLDGGVSVSRLRRVEIADLLRRAPIAARPDAGLYLRDQVVLVTGAGGSIGAELCRQVARAGAADIVMVGHGENTIFETLTRLRGPFAPVRFHPVIVDVRHAARLRAIVARHRPSVVLHAAAHKHVPLMQVQPDEAVANNVQGTRSVLAAALDAGVERFVLISTDKAVTPSSVMGATKRIAEQLVRDAAREHGRAYAAVRFGNVLGSRGSVVPIFERQIAEGGPITVTDPDVTRFFMTVPEATYLVLKAGGLSAGGELFVLNMGAPVRIVDLARDLIRLSGCAPSDIPIAYTGLRAGEKLEESLWEPGADCRQVGDEDLLSVTEPTILPAGAALHRLVNRLVDAADRGDTEAIDRLLREIVPTYAPGTAVRAEPIGA